MLTAKRTLAALNKPAGDLKVADAAICGLIAAKIGALAPCDLMLRGQGGKQVGWAAVNLRLLIHFVVGRCQIWL